MMRKRGEEKEERRKKYARELSAGALLNEKRGFFGPVCIM